MYKKVSESQKKEILEAFTNGEKIKDLSKKFGFSSPTISRQLKSLLGEDEFHNMKNGNSRNKANKVNLKQENEVENYKVKDSFPIDKQEDNSTNNASFETNEEFYEISPLAENINLDDQKDITSKSIDNYSFPKLAFMIVDKKTELEVKILRDYVEWQFLPEVDLSRKTIKIYFDQKNAKQNCNKEQKVIKVPNTNVFKIVTPILLSRGISRILTDDELIAL